MAFPAFGDKPLEQMVELHHRLSEVVQRLPKCRIVIITLGLVELFVDTWSGFFTNTTPWLTASPGRYEFGVLTYEEVMSALERIHRLLSERGHPEIQILVTVSPVPLDATFTGGDIVVANTYSKSVLRTAASQWAEAHDNVYYFPSYEIVMNSARERAWLADGRHVRAEMVGHIMHTFADTYADTPVVTAPMHPGPG